jgi:hypothetical protein
LERTHAPIEIDYLSLDVEGAEHFFNFPPTNANVDHNERLRGGGSFISQRANGFQFLKRLTKWKA